MKIRKHKIVVIKKVGTSSIVKISGIIHTKLDYHRFIDEFRRNAPDLLGELLTSKGLKELREDGLTKK